MVGIANKLAGELWQWRKEMRVTRETEEIVQRALRDKIVDTTPIIDWEIESALIPSHYYRIVIPLSVSVEGEYEAKCYRYIQKTV